MARANRVSCAGHLDGVRRAQSALMDDRMGPRADPGPTEPSRTGSFSPQVMFTA